MVVVANQDAVLESSKQKRINIEKEDKPIRRNIWKDEQWKEEDLLKEDL